MAILKTINSLIINLFTLWIVFFSIITYLYPNYFSSLKSLIVPTLGVIMFGMGMTLKVEDFKRVFLRPLEIALGVSSQYLVMPTLGFLLAKVFNVDPLIAVGLVLVGSCPGGTASNVITYLSKGDLALSVTLTSVSTVLCPLFIPAVMYFFANQWIEIPVIKLFVSSFQIVIIPVLLGIIFRKIFEKNLVSITPFLPSISALSIVFIVGVIVAANSETLSIIGAKITLIVIIHNIFGLITGYLLAKTFGMSDSKARTISIEVGMQNSGLGVALATSHFGSLSALPAALFSVWHNISGSILAWIWRNENKVIKLRGEIFGK